jgi:ABC-2 type transport system permease protein
MTMFLKNVYTMFKREFRGYFYTPLAYVFIGLFICLMAVTFWLFLLSYQFYTQQSIMGQAPQITIDRIAEAFYSNMHVILMIMIPFFTMRLFTTESSQNTFTLLMTSPVRVTEIVIAKFLGAASVVTIMLLMTLVFPIFLVAFSDTSATSAGPDMGIIVSTYLGLFLISFTYVAIGTFWSSITESQLVALMCTFVNVFALWLVSLGAQTAEGVTKSILSQIAVNEQFMSFSKGTLELKAFVMFASYIVFYLFLTNRSIESRSWRA